MIGSVHLTRAWVLPLNRPWLERISGRIGLSYRAGVILLGTLPPIVGSILGDYLMGSYSPLAVYSANLFAFSLVPPLYHTFHISDSAQWLHPRLSQILTRTLGLDLE